MLLNPNCPCGGSSYLTCCSPYHSGQIPAPTAEALMRSRFSAYSQGNIDYLIDTLHPSKRRPIDRRNLTLASSTHWTHLTILNTQKGQATDRRGTVEFIAHYDRPYLGQHHERSRFTKEDGRWYYLDGDTLRD